MLRANFACELELVCFTLASSASKRNLLGYELKLWDYCRRLRLKSHGFGFAGF